MSSDLPSDAPSPEPNIGDFAEQIRERGEPLLVALEERIPGSLARAEAAATWALVIAVDLGLGRERSMAVREATRLSEIGKVYADAELLSKPEAELSAEQRRRLDGHGAIGSSLAEGAGVPPEACGWIRYSRERYDGGGEPEGLFGGAIPLESRIISTARAFEACLERASNSPEGSAVPMVLAVTELRAAAGTELDRGAVEALAAAVGRAGT